mgnify:CR=1 FL=1|jgi:ubiquinone/menaquinone biosynthesis C-methylase UbiE
MELARDTGGPLSGKLPVYVGPPDQTAIVAYSDLGSAAYEDPENLSSLYGQVSQDFLEAIRFDDSDRFVLDVGCGTGFAFDVLGQRFLEKDMVGIGIDPAPGMLKLARQKYRKVSRFRFVFGECEAIPVPECSVDRIISTLAMHWVKDMNAAAAELRRVLRPGGSVEMLLIANEDGFVFKRAVVAALRKHLSFARIMKAASLVQRLRADQLRAILAPHFDGFDVSVEDHRLKVAATFDDHMKWWRARSMPVVADIEDIDAFHATLREELEALAVDGMITFDAAFLKVRITPRAG